MVINYFRPSSLSPLPPVPFLPDDKGSSEHGRNEPSDEVNEDLTPHSFFFFLPTPTLLCIITESVAGSNQQRGHGYLKQRENNICSQEVIFTFSFHSSPNAYEDERRERPCFTLSTRTALPMGPMLWDAGAV